MKLGFTAFLIVDEDMLNMQVFGVAHLSSQVRSTQPTMLKQQGKIGKREMQCY